jgi:hypothetical protein
LTFKSRLRHPALRLGKGALGRRTLVGVALGIAILLLAATSAASFGSSRGAVLATRSASGLPYSTASNDVVQPQPTPGSCDAIGSGLYSRPDLRCTPGALNPQVTQATISQTICQRGWTSTVRPPEIVTESEKRASMAAYGDHLPIGYYEYDHFVPLELGGATNDSRNLWPEPGSSPNPKDVVEDQLRQKVCDRRMTLAQAQRAIVANWVSLARAENTKRPTGNKPSAPSTPAAWCSAAAQYNSRYDDYDVYVHSNQPDQTVTVSGSGGETASWHTDASGYADVYFHAGSSAAGERVNVRVGTATCSTTL